MLNPLSFFSKFIRSSNQKELDRINKIVSKINELGWSPKIKIRKGIREAIKEVEKFDWE